MIKAIGIGDNVVDKYIHTRIMYPGGNALNFSVYAKMLGFQSAYLGTFGDDIPAEHIIKVLNELGIEIKRCRQVPGENGYARVNLEDGDRVFMVGNKGGVQKEHPIILNNADLMYIRGFDIVHTSCYSYNMENELPRIKSEGVLTSYDFSNHFDDFLMNKVCPHVDFNCFSCSHLDDESIKSILKKAHDLGGGLALGTAGSRGAVFFDGIEFYFQAPETVQAVDTLGAGDSFITAFVMNYIQEGKNNEKDKHTVITESLKRGAAFAAQNCMVNGAFGFGLNY